MPNNISIQPTDEKDLDNILSLMNDAILHTYAIYDITPRGPEFIQQWWSQKKLRQEPIFSAFMEDEFAGFITLGTFRQWEAYHVSAELAVYVREKFQGMGIGNALLQTLIESAKAKGLHTLVAAIDAENIPSIMLHQKNGFLNIGTLKEIAFKNNKWRDLCFLQRIL